MLVHVKNMTWGEADDYPLLQEVATGFIRLMARESGSNGDHRCCTMEMIRTCRSWAKVLNRLARCGDRSSRQNGTPANKYHFVLWFVATQDVHVNGSRSGGLSQEAVD